MANLKDKKPESKILALHVGDSGSGKSCASASYGGNNGKVYFMDLDFRVDGVKAYKPLHEKIANGQIEYDQFPTTAEGLEAADRKLDSFKSTEFWKTGIKCVVLSTITTLDDCTFKYGDKYAMPKDTSKANNMKIGKYIKPGFDHYAVEIAILEDFILRLKALPCHAIVEAHWAMKYKADSAGMPKTIPDGMTIALREKVAPTIPVHFNEVFFFEHKVEPKFDLSKGGNYNVHQYLCTTRNQLARTTFSELPDVLDWTNQNFWDILMNALDKENRDALNQEKPSV